jgi:hypothetical protein
VPYARLLGVIDDGDERLRLVDKEGEEDAMVDG